MVGPTFSQLVGGESCFQPALQPFHHVVGRRIIGGGMDMSDAQDGDEGGKGGGLKLPCPVGGDYSRAAETRATASAVMSGTGDASGRLVGLSTDVSK